MVGWKHSPVAECTESESSYVPSTKPADDVGSDPTTKLDLDSKYADESVDESANESTNESATESEPAGDSNLELESRTHDCDNSCQTTNEGCRCWGCHLR